MGKLKWGVIVVVLVLIAAIFFAVTENNEEFSDKKFLFDTLCSVTAYGDDAEEAVAAAFSRAEDIHNETNVFSEKSQVSRINSAKAGEVIAIGEDMAEILTVVSEIEKKSGRAFDASIAPVVLLWDFGGEGRIPSHDEIREALKHVGTDKIIFDPSSKTVVKTDDNAKLDLGGAAKGYAGDEVLEVLKDFEVSGAIVDFGGNILCYGENPKNDSGKWRIGVQKPFAPTGEYDENNIVELSSGAVVTSGTYQRYFERDGKKYHHIIDSQTGYPVERDYDSVTVVAESGLLGDCLSTACFVLGREEGKRLAEEYGGKIYFE